MRRTALGHRLETLNDGLTTFANGERAPMPLIATDIHVQVLAGAAQVTTTRQFRNAEQVPIEAIMTFPVGFDGVVTGLSAMIDGRRMVGVAQGKSEAREIYETALDEGRLSVHHEEALRGIHILSVGALPPGAEVSVELEQVVPMTEVSGKQFLRLPMTAGQLYGNSPLLPSDDMVTSDAVRHEASLQVITEEGRAFLNGRVLAQHEKTFILLNRAVELVIEGGSFGVLQGCAADGRAVEISFNPTHGHNAALDLHVLVDRSGSTGNRVGLGEASILQAIRDGLSDVLRSMRPSDRISLWQFDSFCQFLGAARGDSCSKLVGKLQGPAGGTELSGAVRAAIAGGAKDILVLTDGQTWAHIVDDLKNEAVRISAILVGAGSLDCNVGHLCALTGGQVFYAPGHDVCSPLRSALAALRTVGGAVVGQAGETGPEQVTVLRGGIAINSKWSKGINAEGARQPDAIGRFAAALAIPLLDSTAGESWAQAHSLCSHSTSLVLVDEAGETTKELSQMRKVAAAELHGGTAYPHARMVPCTRPPSAYSCSRMIHHPRGEFQVASHVGPSHKRVKASVSKYELRSNLNGSITTAVLEKIKKAVRSIIGEPERKSMIERLILKLRGRSQESLEVIFSGYDWGRHGSALLAGDFRSLNESHRADVKRLATKIVKDDRHVLASVDLLADEKILALGLIARKLDTRFSKRFARKALRNAPPWVLEKMP